MTRGTRSVLSTISFGVYVAIQSTLCRFQGGSWSILLAAISGAALLVSLRLFAEDVREQH